MKLTDRLLRAEVVSLIVLFCSSILLAGYLAIAVRFGSHNSILDSVGLSKLIFVVSFLTGLVIACLIVSPLLAALSLKMQITVPIASLVGSLPGLLLMFTKFGFGAVSVVASSFGVIVGVSVLAFAFKE